MDVAPTAKLSATTISEEVACRTKSEVFSSIVSAPFRVIVDVLITAEPPIVASYSSAVAASSCVDMRIESVATISVSVVEDTNVVAVSAARSATVAVNVGVFMAVDVVAVSVVAPELTS